MASGFQDWQAEQNRLAQSARWRRRKQRELLVSIGLVMAIFVIIVALMGQYR